ncbi:uncharacterized protein MONOS_14401 [Monocercomonoides exilis]|uniref:uncharacterized protein n=1 Tax=Monocercomonoides exilis TaxID=2049356 RepID=UPI00355A6A46|nr:hypothetical protein MONOS_14401 [Monocercomonoides exilis]|eukprot:MONOS_14401.1-p1 / transcript=MONOS_14401.1 / gene=MONOS_14401 / organism=Monocercomonoides_exilis_PA203 / gene_product=unspecified product / transcript_product=unspecified product / location=Mono_scaffold00995:17062-17343(+) / protein_length=74 / sequence_SO=supercontig / SO=protein_coding / is_pseudo=false
MCIGKCAAQKKSEVDLWTIVYGMELFWKDFVEVCLLGKFVQEEFTEKGEEELSMFLVFLQNFYLEEAAKRKEE